MESFYSFINPENPAPENPDKKHSRMPLKKGERKTRVFLSPLLNRYIYV